MEILAERNAPYRSIEQQQITQPSSSPAPCPLRSSRRWPIFRTPLRDRSDSSPVSRKHAGPVIYAATTTKNASRQVPNNAAGQLQHKQRRRQQKRQELIGFSPRMHACTDTQRSRRLEDPERKSTRPLLGRRCRRPTYLAGERARAVLVCGWLLEGDDPASVVAT